MNQLDKQHTDFLRVCAEQPNRIHPLPADISPADAEQMSNEGLLIKYIKPTGNFFAISRYGAQLVKEMGLPSPELTQLAVKYVESKGYEGAAAQEIVEKQGTDNILRIQADEMRQGTQREVSVPTNEMGKPEIKFRG